MNNRMARAGLRSTKAGLQAGRGGLSEGDGARAVGLLFYRHFHGIAGQEVFHQFGPLDEAERAAVEIVLVAHVVDFFQALYAVKVEVVDELARGVGAVFVDNAEGGRVDHVGHAECLADGFDEGGLSGSHLAVEGKDGGLVDGADKGAGGLGQGFGGGCLDLHGEYGDFQVMR